MTIFSTFAIRMLAVLGLVAMTVAPATAQSLNAADMAFAFGGKATTQAPAAKAGDSVAIASARGMTQAEMQDTEGAWIQIPIMIGRVAISGFTRHGLNQTINRGIRPGAMVSTLRNPTSIRTFTSGPNAGTTRYIGPRSTVVVNSQGRIVSTWGRGR
ncbi:MAG: hypothetical protein NWT12_12680 [Paracoccaceae bacterium]|jgi:hypothetical protein|nr:hypothetical protein [Paracoccaceae bacterium]MDP5367132.1 hypothetical protein [Paracoccaceae bacterium]